MLILFADDDPATLDALSACATHDGFDVALAQDGNEALRLWRDRKPDLCCLDIMMPGMSGYDVCRGIRAEDADVPVMFLSAKSEEIDVVAGLRLGADDFLRKPFGKQELMARINAALRRSRKPGHGRSFTIQDLTVHVDELRAERDSQSIDLSPREVGILEFLYERLGHVVSREELFTHCWKAAYYPASRTLDQHIANLRKKIERDPDNPDLILTIHGAGYRTSR